MSELTDQVLVVDKGDIGFAEFGDPMGDAVIWCHGGPGSRLEPGLIGDEARRAGIRLIGIDRPGYGRSAPQPGRTIAGFVPDAVAVADHLGIERFVTVGVSTGGAFALAIAALASDRTAGAVACCAVTDMRNAACRATMSKPHTLDVWDAPDRQHALAAAIAAHGQNGEKIGSDLREALPQSDLAKFRDPVWFERFMAQGPAMFAFGLEGYTDDRIADRDGWVDFDAASIRCPVIVLQGGRDIMITVDSARHTASLIPGAELRLFEEMGHFSIMDMIPQAVRDLLQRT
jgi:pimeloyl-ACP methyl ester carboxylesterase